MSFDCTNCKERIQKLRRCKEKRMDFTEADDPAVFPMYVSKGGQLFGFCPAKATWDREIMSIFKIAVIAAETGSQYSVGGLEDQPAWWIDLLSWFIPRYNDLKFRSRVRSVVGDGKTNGTDARRFTNSNPR